MKTCQTKGCKNNVIKGNYCATCRSRIYRERYPLRYYFYNLKKSAKKRGVEFNLTRDEFLEWADKEGFVIDSKIEHRDRDSVDRVNPKFGYELINIQKLSVSENSKKWHAEDKLFGEPGEEAPF